MYIFICENNIDGIFSGIYHAYASKYGHKNIQLTTSDTLTTYELFCQYEEIPTNPEHSLKVASTLRQRLGEDTYMDICYAIQAFESPKKQAKNISKADAVYKTIVLSLTLKDSSKVLNHLSNPYVNRVFQLSRSAYNEAHHFKGYIRFKELENGILFARIHPKNQVLDILGQHFSERLPMENFIIYDETRKSAALHKSGSGYILSSVPEVNQDFINNFSEKEREYQQLWQAFFHSIAIEARKNPKLQSQNIPKRFWSDLVEFTPDTSYD